MKAIARHVESCPMGVAEMVMKESGVECWFEEKQEMRKERGRGG